VYFNTICINHYVVEQVKHLFIYSVSQLYQSSGMEINIVKLLILKQNIIQKIC